MTREFKLPDVGEGLTEAEVVRWLVEPGDTVTEDQPVAEVETDKAVVEVPSPVNGTVAEIRAEEGEMVTVGEVIITFSVEGESGAGSEAEEGEAAAEPPEPEPGPESDAAETDGQSSARGGRVFAAPSARRLARELGVDIEAVAGSGPGGRVTETDVRAAAEGTTGPKATPESAAEDEEVLGEQAADHTGDGTTAAGDAPKQAVERVSDEPGGAATTPQSGEAADRDRTLATPATRQLARELGVDIGRVPASEQRDGEAFVTEADVEAFAESGAAAVDSAGTTADAAATGAAGPEATGAPATPAPGGEERVPYRGVRRTIGEQMERSAYTAPHVTHHDQVDVSALVDLRERLKPRAEERGVKLTYLPIVMQAVVAGLREFPILNSELDEEAGEIVKKGYYNIGVATRTDAGLMVPVVKNVGEKRLLAVAGETNDLVARARDRSIAREEMQDGTFTITNFGAIGGEYATPIINYPETAILGLGAVTERPWVVDRDARSASERASGDAASKEVVPRHVMTLSLSIDHRVIDGAEAAQFVNALKEYLRDPELLLLE